MSRRPPELSRRDRAILRFVCEVQVASTRQIERLVFPVEGGGSDLSAARRCRRVLQRLTDERLLLRLDRRIGGVRAGSSSHLYQLGTLGRRALGLSGRGPTWEPGGRYVEHALAAGELHVELVERRREGALRDLHVTHEPATWRRFDAPGGLLDLKPDLLVELTTPDGWEVRWFVEIDRATEHLPTVIRKCERYQAYWHSGAEAAHHEVFPRVLWSVPDQRRAEAIARAIAARRSLSRELFTAAVASEAAAVLTTSTN